LEWTLDERLQAPLGDQEAGLTEARFDGRVGVRLMDNNRLDHTRVRELGVHLVRAKLALNLGRFDVAAGGHRLVDGAQGLLTLGEGVQLGAWGGLAPDPYTTAPALRYGGGPVVAVQQDTVQARFTGEMLSTADGIDRLAGVFDGRYEPSSRFELSSRVDLQVGVGRGNGPVEPADAMLMARVDPSDDLRVTAFVDAYTSWAYLWSEKQDPGLSRFAARSTVLDPGDAVPQDAMDSSVYTVLGASVRQRHLGSADLDLRADARLRYHPVAERRYGRFRLKAQLPGRFSGTTDLGAEITGWVLGDHAGATGTLYAWSEPWESLPLAFDLSAEGGVRPIPNETVLGPSLYTDLFVDGLIGPRLALSAGLAYSTAMDRQVWDMHHTAMVRLTWNHRRITRQQTDEPGDRALDATPTKVWEH